MNTTASAIEIDVTLVRRLLCQFLQEEVHKVGFDHVVVGLSGGVDSALAAALAAEALGAANVVPVLMPYSGSSRASLDDAELLCRQLGLAPVTIAITEQIDAYFADFPDAGRGRRGNKMARERMAILYDQSWAHRALVVGTSNKTELLLGYGTIYGDMAHALNPLGDLYKTQVYALARAMLLPPAILEKRPSADLWEGQSDEDDLGFSYAEVDMLLQHLVDERRSREELRELGYADSFVEDVAGRIRDSQYKRRPPLIAKLSARTIDREFRYPRDWGR